MRNRGELGMAEPISTMGGGVGGGRPFKTSAGEVSL